MYYLVKQIGNLAEVDATPPFVFIGASEKVTGFYAYDGSEDDVSIPADLNLQLIFQGSLEENPFILNFLKFNQWVIATSSSEEMRDIQLLLEKIGSYIDLGKKIIFKTTLTYLLIKIVWLKTISNVRIRRNGLRSDKVLKLFAEMKINHSDHRSLSYYAQRIHVSENYLGELCQKETGLSFRMISNLWLIIRILDSFYLTDRNFSEIAHLHGFTDQAHFNHFFKKHLQITPSEFRKGVLIK